MEKTYIVRLSKKERETLLDVVKKRKGSFQKVSERCMDARRSPRARMAATCSRRCSEVRSSGGPNLEDGMMRQSLRGWDMQRDCASPLRLCMPSRSPTVRSQCETKGSLVVAAVSRRILVDPVFLFPRHPAATGDLARRPSAVERTGLGAVTESLKAKLLLSRIPLVDDHFDRHPAAPDAG